jgi:poly(3-hydroxybutyrate) depolymerase
MQSLLKLSTAFVMIAIVSIPARATEPERMTWDVNGTQREALVYPPTPSPIANSAPLVFVFHGHGGAPQNIARSMHLQDIWPEAIVVYRSGCQPLLGSIQKARRPVGSAHPATTTTAISSFSMPL